MHTKDVWDMELQISVDRPYEIRNGLWKEKSTLIPTIRRSIDAILPLFGPESPPAVMTVKL